jgi:response regulator RpfG family c-di-GMP phosphodiesterase
MVEAKSAREANQVVFAAAQSDFESRLQFWLKDLSQLQLIPSPDLEELIQNPPENLNPRLILVDGRGETNRTLELAQTLKVAFPAPLVVFYDGSTKLNFSVLKKNGADAVLHIHYDAEFIIDKLLELTTWSEDSSPPISLLNPLAPDDLSNEMDLNFDLYMHLPGNQKSLMVRRRGQTVDSKLIEKVKASHQNLYFKKTQMKLFMEYSRTLLSLRDSSERIGATDKVIRTRQRIWEIISQFFDQESTDFKGGKVVLEHCEQILKEFEINQWKSPSGAFKTMAEASGRPRSFYSDAMSLCVYAGVLGFLLEKNPEEIQDLALAGLLHNVGLATLNLPVLDPKIEELSESARIEYLSYPERSVNIIKGKKVPLNPRVTDLIWEHRELPGGKGFPRGNDKSNHNGLSGILQFAYELLRLTQLEKNQAKHTLTGAFEYLNQHLMDGKSQVDTTILIALMKKIKGLT